MYININSDHPPNVKKELPSMIQNRLSVLSKNKVMFGKYKEPYEKALKTAASRKPQNTQTKMKTMLQTVEKEKREEKK